MSSFSPRSPSLPDRKSTVFRISLYVFIVLFMGNLGAMIDRVLHPGIPYFHPEHWLVGGTTALAMILLFGAFEIYLVRHGYAEEAILRSVKDWRQTFDFMTDAVWIADKASRVLQANAASEAIFQRPIGEITGKLCCETVHGSPEPIPGCPALRARESLARQTMELQVGDRWMDITVDPILDAEGRFAGIIHMARDATDRRQAAEIKNAHLRLSQLATMVGLDSLIQAALDEAERFTGSSIGYFHFVLEDQETLLLQAWSTNTLRNMCRAEGKGRHEPISQAGVWVDCFHARGPVIHNDYRSLPHRKGLPEGHAPVTRDLSVPIFRRDSIVAIIGVGNKATEYTEDDVNVLRDFAIELIDLVDGKRTEEGLRLSEERHRAILRTAMEGYWLVDMEGRLLEVNETYCRMVGYDERELLAMRISDLDATETAEDAVAHLSEIKLWGERRFEARHLRKDGGLVDVEVSAQYRPVEGGRVVAFLRDITAHKRLETERNKLQGQLLQAMKMEAVGRLAGGIAHDFNNLLTVITGYSELLLQKVGTESPLREGVEEIKRAGERAASFTQQLLAFSRKQLIEPKVVRLDRLVEELHSMLARLIGEDISVRITSGESPGWVRIDPAQFQQVLMNLAANARDAMPGGGKIVIETANVDLDEAYCATHSYVTPGRYVMLSVSDTGKGMSKEVQEHIFEPFFTTKAQGSGTGFGLATTYGVVKQSGGSIEVYSEVGVGTTFRIYLPRVEEEAAEPKKKPPRKDLPGGAETVLLVEDEDSVRHLCARILVDLGYRVVQARSGPEAIALAKGHGDRIDLLLTDVVMPEMNGRELATQMLLLHPETKVLFASGYTEDVIGHHGILDGEVSFLGKPYSREGLAKKVREVLDTA